MKKLGLVLTVMCFCSILLTGCGSKSGAGDNAAIDPNSQQAKDMAEDS